jgi:hypothetical protein
MFQLANQWLKPNTKVPSGIATTFATAVSNVDNVDIKSRRDGPSKGGQNKKRQQQQQQQQVQSL